MGPADADSGKVRSTLPKCVVWDLDGTLWLGSLAERGDVSPLPERVGLIHRLDSLGVLQSIASRNERANAMEMLARHGLAEFFLHAQIGWSDKSASLRRIADRLNVGLGALILVDDDPYERAEVRAAAGPARAVSAEALAHLLREWGKDGRPMTPEASRRRAMYLADAARSEAEERFTGPRSEFLAWLGIQMAIRVARPSDMGRVVELAERASQMSSAGGRVDSGWLERVGGLPGDRLLVASLRDRFGDYGTIGVALLRADGPVRQLLLFAVSCRVMNRGAGTIFLNWMSRQAVARGERMEVAFRGGMTNRPLLVTLRLAGFREVGCEGEAVTFVHDGKTVRECPAHVCLAAEEEAW